MGDFFIPYSSRLYGLVVKMEFDTNNSPLILFLFIDFKIRLVCVNFYEKDNKSEVSMQKYWLNCDVFLHKI